MKEIAEAGKTALYQVHKPGFLIALFAAPILTAIVLFWLYLIPVVAVLFGGIPWLFLGGPALWITLRYKGPGPLLILSAFMANALGTPLLLAVYLLIDDPHGFFLRGMTDLLFIPLFGCVFSAIWGAVFWWVFQGMTKTRAVQSLK